MTRELIVVLKPFSLNLYYKMKRIRYKHQGKVESWKVRVKSLHSLIMSSFKKKQNRTKQNSTERDWVLDLTCFFLNGSMLIRDSYGRIVFLHQGELATVPSERAHMEWGRMEGLPLVQPEKWNQFCWTMRWQMTLTQWYHFL